MYVRFISVFRNKVIEKWKSRSANENHKDTSAVRLDEPKPCHKHTFPDREMPDIGFQIEEKSRVYTVARPPVDSSHSLKSSITGKPRHEINYRLQ